MEELLRPKDPMAFSNYRLYRTGDNSLVLKRKIPDTDSYAKIATKTYEPDKIIRTQYDIKTGNKIGESIVGHIKAKFGRSIIANDKSIMMPKPLTTCKGIIPKKQVLNLKFLNSFDFNRITPMAQRILNILIHSMEKYKIRF